MIPVDKVREIISKHELLENKLSSDKIDKKNFAKLSKEYSDLNEILINAKQYLSFDKTEKDLVKIARKGYCKILIGMIFHGGVSKNQKNTLERIDNKLRKILLMLPGEKYIFTNGTKKHAENVIKKLNLDFLMFVKNFL